MTVCLSYVMRWTIDQYVSLFLPLFLSFFLHFCRSIFLSLINFHLICAVPVSFIKEDKSVKKIDLTTSKYHTILEENILFQCCKWASKLQKWCLSSKKTQFKLGYDTLQAFMEFGIQCYFQHVMPYWHSIFCISPTWSLFRDTSSLYWQILE